MKCKLLNFFFFDKISIFNFKDGLYAITFADALEQIILSPYRKLLCELEKDLLRDQFLNVSYIQSSLENVFFFNE